MPKCFVVITAAALVGAACSSSNTTSSGTGADSPSGAVIGPSTITVSPTTAD